MNLTLSSRVQPSSPFLDLVAVAALTNSCCSKFSNLDRTSATVTEMAALLVGKVAVFQGVKVDVAGPDNYSDTVMQMTSCHGQI